MSARMLFREKKKKKCVLFITSLTKTDFALNVDYINKIYEIFYMLYFIIHDVENNNA